MRGEGREGRGEAGCWGRAMGLGSGELDRTEVQQDEGLEVGWGGETGQKLNLLSNTPLLLSFWAPHFLVQLEVLYWHLEISSPILPVSVLIS